MGGLGSGRNAGFGAPTCEAFPFIDILQYSRNDVLSPGSRTEVFWTYCDEEIGSGKITAYESSIVLDWCFDGVDGNRTHHEEIELSFTQPHLGGRRPWFVCPACCSRRLKLYCGGRFLCRECLGLQYQSTRDSRPLRMVRRLNRLRRQLGGTVVAGELLPVRPKGMHQRTYHRLLERETELNDQIIKIEASLIRSKLAT